MAKKKQSSQRTKASSFKCILCGEMVKVTRWRKHLAFAHKLGDLPKYYEYFDNHNKKKETCKCRLCSKVISEQEWRSHLANIHGIGKNWRFRDYFINPKEVIRQIPSKVYEPPVKAESDWKCGDVLNGPPRIKIVFNALCTNRRKH